MIQRRCPEPERKPPRIQWTLSGQLCRILILSRVHLLQVSNPRPAKSPSDSQSTLRSKWTDKHSRPNSRGSTHSLRLNVSVTGCGPRDRAVSRPISHLPTVSTSVSPSNKRGTGPQGRHPAYLPQPPRRQVADPGSVKDCTRAAIVNSQ